MADEAKQPSFIEKFNMPFSELWEKYKLFLIGFGLLILIVKFRSVIIDLLISDAHKKVDEAQKKDATLHQEENKANDEANRLRDEANKLSENKPKVDEDWNKKK